VESIGTAISIYRCEIELNEAERIGYEGRQERMAKGRDKWGEKGIREGGDEMKGEVQRVV